MAFRNCSILVILSTCCCTVFSRPRLPAALAPPDTCQPLQIRFCSRILPYNGTSFPNFYNHATQDDAEASLRPFLPLIHSNRMKSGELLHKVWCSMLAPPCSRDAKWKPPPCRNVCLKTLRVFKREHKRVLTKGEMSDLKKMLDCDRLPNHHRVVGNSVDGTEERACRTNFEDKLQKIVFEQLKSTSDKTNSRTKKQSGGVSPSKPNKKKGKTRKKIYKPKPHKSCHCTNVSTSRVGRKHYLNNAYDYAIKAKYLEVEGLPHGAPKVVRIKVESVLKSSKVKIPQGDLTLWAASGCVCQKLVQGERYMFLGYEDEANARLLFDDSCMAVTWKGSWRSYIEKWERRMLKKTKQEKRQRKKQMQLQANMMRTAVGSQKHANAGRRKNQRHRKTRKRDRKQQKTRKTDNR